MDHEADDFESSLREFSPAKVPDALQSRILEIADNNPEKELHPAAGTGNIRKFHFLSPLAAAAAILIAATGVFFAVLNNIETNPAANPDGMAMAPEPLQNKCLSINSILFALSKCNRSESILRSL